MGFLQPDVGYGGRDREAGLSETPKAITVHDLRQAHIAAAAAAETGEPVTLLSAPDAAGTVGPAWFAHLVDLARAEQPQAVISCIFDCGSMPGYALAALRHGLGAVRYDGPTFPAVAAIAQQLGASVTRRRPDSIDLMTFPDDDAGAQAACRQWLRAGSDAHSTNRPRRPI